MKKLNTLIMCSLLSIGAISSSYAANASRMTKEPKMTATTEMEKDYDDFKTEMDPKLYELDKKIKKLKTDGKEVKENMISSYKERRKELNDDYFALKSKTEKEYDELKKDIKEEYAELKTDVEKHLR